MKKNDKKEIKYLNVCMDKALHEEFEQFCKDMGMSKTGACENARQYGHHRHHTLLSQLPHHSRTERHGRNSHAYCAQGRTLGDPTRGGG